MDANVFVFSSLKALRSETMKEMKFRNCWRSISNSLPKQAIPCKLFQTCVVLKLILFVNLRFPWHQLKPLVKKKVEVVIDKFHKENPNSYVAAPNVNPFNYDEMKKVIVLSIEDFYGAPFTIQRICELLTVPGKHYKRTDKFMRGLEKNILVVSHVEPKSAS